MEGWTNPTRIGYVPSILLPFDPAPIREQLQVRYAHGGGYRPFPNKDKFTLTYDRERPNEAVLAYPEDPDYREWARCYFPLSQELVIMFDSAITAIIQDDGSFELVRLD